MGTLFGAQTKSFNLLLGAMTFLLALAFPATSVAQSKTESGYIDLPDGVQLKYTAWLPEGKGPFPVLMQYEGYNAGSFPDRANSTFVRRMLEKGYAILGVSLRGSACSSGVWEVFNLQQAQDGAFAVEWAAQQPWSNGRIATFSFSYGGIMQLWVASMNPPHLVAAAPGMPVADTYRDIAFPGGIFNTSFPPAWGASLNLDWSMAAQKASEQGDVTCLQNYAAHAVPNNANTVVRQMAEHPFDDQWHYDHSPINQVRNIRVPVLAIQAWQDEETGGRQSAWFEQLDPEKTWLISTNGHHLMYWLSLPLIANLEAFYDYHLKGINNGFDKTPRVQIWHETSVGELTPRSITTVDRLPVKVEKVSLFLADGGLLSRDISTHAEERSTSYPYPVESPPVVDGSSQAQESPRANTWSTFPALVSGRAVFTTPPLSETAVAYNSASADLWVSTTAPDVDVQVTLTEVRPDGQEVWIQRGWLRASHRALDMSRSTELRPYHPHTAGSVADMPAGEPQLLRVELAPFAHAFRAGSSIRMYVEQPSMTGLWEFSTVKAPQLVSIHHSRQHPSKLVLGLLPNAVLQDSYPDCAKMHSQPCRANPIAQPDGRLSLAGAAGVADASAKRGGGALDMISLLLALMLLGLAHGARRAKGRLDSGRAGSAA